MFVTRERRRRSRLRRHVVALQPNTAGPLVQPAPELLVLKNDLLEVFERDNYRIDLAQFAELEEFNS